MNKDNYCSICNSLSLYKTAQLRHCTSIAETEEEILFERCGNGCSSFLSGNSNENGNGSSSSNGGFIKKQHPPEEIELAKRVVEQCERIDKLAKEQADIIRHEESIVKDTLHATCNIVRPCICKKCYTCGSYKIFTTKYECPVCTDCFVLEEDLKGCMPIEETKTYIEGMIFRTKIPGACYFRRIGPHIPKLKELQSEIMRLQQFDL
jgi:hypothetical protein